MLEINTAYLEQRVQHLEETQRFSLEALELAASLGDFQASINKREKPKTILDETGFRLRRLIPFRATAFFLVNEVDADFLLSACDPDRYGEDLQREIEGLIDNGTFAWSLRERRPVIVSTQNRRRKLLLHVMATNTRVRGMFIGLLDKKDAQIADIALALLSIILANSANALESNELFRMVREVTANLEKKENYRMLFEAAPDGVEVLDARWNIVDCNESYMHLVDRPRNEIIGRNTAEFFSSTDRDIYEEKLYLLKKNGCAEGEVKLVRKDGTCVTVWRKEKGLFDPQKGFVGLIIYNRDISKLKQAQKEKAALQVELQRAEKMKSLGALAGGVAHDLNNVLSGIVSYPEVLLMGLPDDSSLKKPIEIIQRSGQKAAAIVEDLLTLARRGVGLQKVVNLNRIVTDYLLSPEHQSLKTYHDNIRFEKDLDKDLMNMVGSSVHLSKAVMNLISNAAEAMPHGGKIVISTENRYIDKTLRGYDHVKEGDYVVMRVVDEGIGISKADIDQIFEPFYTKKKMGRSGTGLGMAVVWGTVKDHNGNIDVQSTEGEGSQFTLYFPSTRRQFEKDAPLIAMETYMSKGESILVVDDVKEQRQIAGDLLETLGYAVTSVDSGEAAVAYLQKTPVDLLLLDMIMEPGINGLQTYRQILKINPAQKAIIASGFSETAHVTEALRLGAGAYIKKPYLLDKIGIAIRGVLTA